MMSPLTRADIARILEGAMIITTYDTAHGLPLLNARWSRPTRVVEVFARKDDINGKAFVCFYTEFGENARLSGGAKEGDMHLHIVADAS
jgi:hypothetical protein